jgi:hypothetical protein
MSEGSREMFPRRDRLAGLNWGPRQAEVNVPKRSATENLPGPALGLCWPSSAKHQDANLLWATKGGCRQQRSRVPTIRLFRCIILEV